MAPPGRFDDVLKMINDAQDRAAIEATLAKHPDAKKALEQVDKFAADGIQYNTWHANPAGFPEYDKRYKAHEKLTADLEAANETIKALKAGKPGDGNGGGETVDLADMTLEQIGAQMEERLRAKGFVTKAEAERIADEKARAASANVESRVYQHGLVQVEDMEDCKRDYQTQFGKALDRTAFGKFLTDGKYASISDGYRVFTAQDRENKLKADSFEQGKVQGAKEKADELAKLNSESALRGLPTDMTGGQGFISHPGTPPAPVAMKDIPENYQLGQRGGFKLAHAVAAQIEADRAAGILK